MPEIAWLTLVGGLILGAAGGWYAATAMYYHVAVAADVLRRWAVGGLVAVGIFTILYAVATHLPHHH